MRTRPIRGCTLALLLTPVLGSGVADSADEFIVVQSTTSTQSSGLYEAVLPDFEQATGIDVRVVAVGTGQALANAANCDGDVLLVHAKAAEEAFVRQGHGVSRSDLMYNDFVIVGPDDDPAGIAGADDAVQAMKTIAFGETPFASRGDDSGTHKAEMSLWAKAGVDPTTDSGGWYRETGSGMGATLNVATGMGAYVLTDRATWISYVNQGDARVLVEGDPALFNQYGVILVDPDHCPTVKQEPAQRFIDWLLSDQGQERIAAYRIAGQQLFFPNAP